MFNHFKMRFHLFLIMSILFDGLSAQPSPEDSLKVYHKLKDRASIILTIAYMEDLRGSKWEAKNYDSIGDIEYKTYKQIKGYLSTADSIDINKVSNILDNGQWPKARANILESYRNFFDESNKINFDEIAFRPDRVSNYRRDLAIDELKCLYKDVLEDLMNSKSDNLNKSTENTFIPEELYPARKTSSSNKGSIITNPFFIASLLFNILLVIYITIKERKNLKLQEKPSNKRNPYGQERGLSQGQNKKTSITNTSDNAIAHLKRRVKELENELNLTKRLEEKISTTVKTSGITERTIEVELHTGKEHPVQLEVGYFSSPFEKNKFSHEDFKIEEDNKSLYKVESVGIDEWTLTLNENANFKRALRSPNVFLDPVCDSSNLYSSEATAISVEENGLIIRSGDDWNVIKRPKIKFI